MDLFFGGLKNLFALFFQWLGILFGSPFSLSVWLMLLLASLTVVLWFISGLFAANTAERRGKAPHLHFVLGLILPWFYPMLLRVSLKPEQGSPDALVRARENAEQQAIEEQKKTEEEKQAAEQRELEQEKLDPTHWTQHRVDRIRRSPDGHDNGPFTCQLRDGRVIDVLRIPDTTPEVVVLELPNPSGGDPLTLRLPYKKISLITIDDSKS